MSLAVTWPAFGQTEPPLTGLWPTLRTFAADLELRTGGQVHARLDAVKLPHIPLGKAFDLRFGTPQDPARLVTMLNIVEQTEGLILGVSGQPEILVRTQQELIRFLEIFAGSPRVAEMVYVLREGRK